MPLPADRIIGQSMRVDARVGVVIQKHWLQAPRMVQGNQLVTVRYQTGTIEVTSSAVALSDGALNEQIRVRQGNGRVMTATISGPGMVTVQ